jgi:ribosomal protein L14
MKQLTIFDAPLHDGVVDLPRAILEPANPKIEEAIASLRELKAISLESDSTSQAHNVGIVQQSRRELVEGCIVRSSTSYKGKTGKLIEFKNYAHCLLAIVEYEYRGSIIHYPCTIATLEVVE